MPPKRQRPAGRTLRAQYITPQGKKLLDIHHEGLSFAQIKSLQQGLSATAGQLGGTLRMKDTPTTMVTGFNITQEHWNEIFGTHGKTPKKRRKKK